MLRNFAYLLVLVTPCFGSLNLWASGNDAVATLVRENMGLCKLSAPDGATVVSVRWQYGAGTKSEQPVPQEYIASVWLSENSDLKVGAAQGSYVLYNMRDKIRETAGLISSNDWIVSTSNPDLFSYKDGILFSMDQDGASTSLGTDNPDIFTLSSSQDGPASTSPRGMLTIIGGCLSERDNHYVLDAAIPCDFRLAVRKLSVTLTKEVSAAPTLECSNGAHKAKATVSKTDKATWVFDDIYFANKIDGDKKK